MAHLSKPGNWYWYSLVNSRLYSNFTSFPLMSFLYSRSNPGVTKFKWKMSWQWCMLVNKDLTGWYNYRWYFSFCVQNYIPPITLTPWETLPQEGSCAVGSWHHPMQNRLGIRKVLISPPGPWGKDEACMWVLEETGDVESRATTIVTEGKQVGDTWI
jgi:hypothetical protein